MKQFIAIVVIFIVAVVAFILFTMKPREITPKDIHPVPGLVKSVSEASATPSPRPDSAVHEKATLTAPSTAAPAKIEKKKIIEPEKQVVIDPQGNYYIVLNSFRNLNLAKEKAENLKKKLNAEILILPLSADGYYRLSYGKYENKDDAEKALINVRINIRPEAWIYSPPKNQ